MVCTARSLVALTLFGLAACPEPCPEQLAPEEAATCAPEEPGGVALRNASFETYGAPMRGWSFVEADGVQVETIAGVDGCTAISLRASEPLAKPARIVKLFDATALRGQRVRLSMWARVEPMKPGRGPSMVLRSRAGTRSNVTEVAGTEVVGERWALHSLEFDVPPDTDKLEIQVGLSRIRQIDLDGFAIDRVGPACPGCEAAAPISVIQRENLVAFSKLLGYVRYFHPSAEVEVADWDALALAGAQAALRAEDPSDLVAALERVFLPVAPTLSFDAVGPGPADASSLWLAWDHDGVRSVRRPLPWLREHAPAGALVPEPPHPLRVELGRGLIAWVPVALPWDAAGATRSPARPDKPAAFRADGSDRVTRLAAIALLGARVAHFSPRLELLERPLEDVLGDSFEKAGVASDRYGLRDVVLGVLAALQDGSAQAHYRWDARRMFAMALQWRWVEGELVITAVDPVHTAKLQVGDVVEAIDGRPVAEALAATMPLTQGRSEARRHVYATSLLARGLGGTRSIQVHHIDGAEISLRVPMTHLGLGPIDPRPEPISEFDGVMYVDLARVRADDLRAAAGRLQAAEAVVLDARWGTDGSARKRLVALFGDIGRSEPRHVIWPGGQHSFSAAEPATEDFAGTVALPPRVAVLVDERTAGEFEGVADAMRARGAVLVGSPTAAAPGEYTEFTLPGGLMLGMAEAPYNYVSGQPGLEPLQPDIAVTPTVAGIAAGRDEVLERALAGLEKR